MSGGSHDYAYSKVRFIAEDFGDLHGSEICEGEGHMSVGQRMSLIEDQVLRKHPLRVALSRFLDGDLCDLLRTIEWCDSGDKQPDEWIEGAVAFLDKHGIEYDEGWEGAYAALRSEQKLDDDDAFAERHDSILAARGLDRFRSPIVR